MSKFCYKDVLSKARSQDKFKTALSFEAAIFCGVVEEWEKRIQRGKIRENVFWLSGSLRQVYITACGQENLLWHLSSQTGRFYRSLHIVIIKQSHKIMHSKIVGISKFLAPEII